MSTPSIRSAIQKINELLAREEKIRWFGIVAFALMTSFLEVVTASVIVLFAQVLNNPETGLNYLTRIGFSGKLVSGRIVFYLSIIVGMVYLLKNSIAAAEVFFQNFSAQKMNYNFKNRLLRSYSELDYSFYLTRDSVYNVSVVGGDADTIFFGWDIIFCFNFI